MQILVSEDGKIIRQYKFDLFSSLPELPVLAGLMQTKIDLPIQHGQSPYTETSIPKEIRRIIEERNVFDLQLIELLMKK
jgi:hypothetical protein